MSADLEAARRVKDLVRQRLAGDERLRGVGVARRDDAVGSFAVVVRVSQVEHVAALGLPDSVDGVVVEVIAVGEVVALEADAGEADTGAAGYCPPAPGPAAGDSGLETAG